MVNILATGGEVQQPGTLQRDPLTAPPGVPTREHLTPPLFVKQMVGTKYSVLTHMVDNVRAYQILPQDMKRKRAWIKLQAASSSVAQQVTRAVPNLNVTPAILSTTNSVLVTGISTLFTTGATVSNRQVIPYFNGPAFTGYSNGFQFPSLFVQTASLACTYYWSVGAAATPPGGANTIITSPLPSNLLLPPGNSLNIYCVGIQGGDSFGWLMVTYQILGATAAGGGVLIGPEPMVDPGSFTGYPMNPGDLQEYTSGSPLFAVGSSASPVQVNTLVEMYDGIAAVN